MNVFVDWSREHQKHLQLIPDVLQMYQKQVAYKALFDTSSSSGGIWLL